MKPEESKKIIQDNMKDMEISNTKRKKKDVVDSSDANDVVNQKVPTLEELKKKYVSGSDRTRKEKKSTLTGEKDDIDVKLIKKKNADSGSDELREERTIIISKNKGLLGSQG